jgi:nicotinamidase-related amidase
LEDEMAASTLLKPQPQSVRLDPATTAIAVLDLSVRCDDASDVCSELMKSLGAFLERARTAGVPIIFTSGYALKGTPEAEVATALKRRPSEPLIHPDAFDKFQSGELQTFLESHNVKNLVVVGSSTHVCVLYTATTAARVYGYNVVIPIDGVNTRDTINHDVALHQLQVIPRASSLITFSTEDTITFD